MTELDLTKLREIAEEATQGPWQAGMTTFGDPSDGATHSCVRIEGAHWTDHLAVAEGCAEADLNMAHIAAFDPPTVLALIGRIESAKSLHRQIPVHDECEHDADYGCSQFYVFGAYLACEESFIGWACQHCCYDDEIQIEYCPHEGNHRDVGKEDSCPTMRALIGGDSDD